MDDEYGGGGAALRQTGARARSSSSCASPPRGAADGIRKDLKRTRGEEPTRRGGSWSNSFLNGKSWHPMNFANQKALWLAEQQAAARIVAEEKARAEAEESAEFLRNSASLPGKEQRRLRKQAEVSFLYQAPPGFREMQEREAAAEASKAAAAAAAAVAAAEGASEAARAQPHVWAVDAFGRKVPTAADFPAMAGAPREPGTQPSLSCVQPLGVLPPRAVQCLRCRQLGHDVAACTQPRAAGALQQWRLMEDPLTLMKARSELSQHARFALKAGATGGRSPPRGGLSADSESHQLIASEEHGAQAGLRASSHDEALAALAALAQRGGDEAVRSALDALPKHARKALLKAYGRAEKQRRRAAREAEAAAARDFLRAAGAAGLQTKAERRQRQREEEDRG